MRTKKRKTLAIILDSETGLLAYDPPATDEILDSYEPRCYRIGVSYFDVDSDWYRLLNSGAELNWDLVKDSEFITFDGLNCEKKFTLWLKIILQKYERIYIYIFNASYDMKYIEPYLIDEFGGQHYNSVLKDNDDMVYSQFDFPNRKVIKICDPWAIQKNKSYAERLKAFKGCEKEVLPHYLKWWKPDKNGEIEGYWTFEDTKEADIGTNSPIRYKQRKWIDWNAVKDKEDSYLKSDVIPQKLIIVENNRSKTAIKEAFEKQFKYKLTPREATRLYNKTNTSGELYKFFCNLYLFRVFMDGVSNYYTKDQLRQGRSLILTCLADLDFSPYRDRKGDVPNIYKALFQSTLNPLDTDIYRDENNSFMGAITTGTNITKWKASDKYPIGMAFDINSQYPYVMSGNMPVGRLRDEPLEGYENKRIFLCEFQQNEEGAYIWPNWKKPYSALVQTCIGCSVTNKYIKANLFDISYLYLYEEFYRTMEKMCDNLPTIAHIKFRPAFPFLKEFIDFLMEMKIAAGVYKDMEAEKKKGKKIDEIEFNRLQNLYAAVKLILNSGYGKMCEKVKEDTHKWCGKEMKYVPIEKWHEDRGKIYTDNNIYDLMSGAYIPVMGKVITLDSLKKVIDSGGITVYTDTDSMLAALQKGAKPEDIIPIHKSKLGAWKYEFSFTEFGYPGKAKKYYCKKPSGELIVKYSGIKTSFMSALADQRPDLIPLLYDPKQNFLIIDAGNTSTVIDNKRVITTTDKSFNSHSENFYDHYGNKEARGVEENTGIIGLFNGKIYCKIGKFTTKVKPKSRKPKINNTDI